MSVILVVFIKDTQINLAPKLFRKAKQSCLSMHPLCYHSTTKSGQNRQNTYGEMIALAGLSSFLALDSQDSSCPLRTDPAMADKEH